MEGEGSLILLYISGHSVLKPQYSVKEIDIYLDKRCENYAGGRTRGDFSSFLVFIVLGFGWEP